MDVDIVATIIIIVIIVVAMVLFVAGCSLVNVQVATGLPSVADNPVQENWGRPLAAKEDS